MWLTLIFIAITLLILWRKKVYSFWEGHKVPSPNPFFPVGNLGAILSMKKHSGVVFMEWYNHYKEYAWIGYYKTVTPSIMLRDLDLIKDVLIKDYSSFQSNDMDFNTDVDVIMASNPFVLNGEKWKEARQALSPLFTLNRCKLLFPLMQPAIDRMKAYVDKNGADRVHDAKVFSSLFTTENVVKCGYSMDAGCFDNPKNEFREMGKKIFQPSLATGLKFLLLIFVPIVSKIVKFRFLPEDIAIWLSKVLENNVAERKKTPLPQEDLLQWLINGVESDKMNDTTAISHAFSFFIEGFETSSNVMSFALYSLAKNTDVQQRLREEINEVLGEQDGGQFTFDALQEMSYLDCVIQETLRLYPPGVMMAKRCTKDYEMPLLPGQTTPFTCPAGTTITIPVLGIHMDEDLYPEPEKFDPLRFSEEERKTRHKTAFLPFGEGPRMCLGNKFALTQIKLAVAHLVKEYNVTLDASQKPVVIDPAALMFQSKDNLVIKFKRLSGDD